MNQLIAAVQYAYGFTKKEAKAYIKTIDNQMKQLLLGEYQHTCHLSFYND